MDNEGIIAVCCRRRHSQCVGPIAFLKNGPRHLQSSIGRGAACLSHDDTHALDCSIGMHAIDTMQSFAGVHLIDPLHARQQAF